MLQAQWYENTIVLVLITDVIQFTKYALIVVINSKVLCSYLLKIYITYRDRIVFVDI